MEYLNLILIFLALKKNGGLNLITLENESAFAKYSTDQLDIVWHDRGSSGVDVAQTALRY